MNKKLAVILINWNGHADTIECIESIQASSLKDLSVFVIDNYSSDNSVKLLTKWAKENNSWGKWSISNLKDFKTIANFSNNTVYLVKSGENLGFAGGNNAIWATLYKDFEYVLILNNDTVVDKNALLTMVKTMDEHHDIAALSCDIRYYQNPNQLWRAGGKFAWYGDRKYYQQQKIDAWKKSGDNLIETEFITGCAMVVRKSTVENIGLYTERFFFGEEDFNYCQRLKRAGLRVSTILSATIYHKVSGSIKKQQAPYNKFILHYTNRIINQKFVMPKLKWVVWRVFYLSAVYLKGLRTFRNMSQTRKVLQRIIFYTSTLDAVSYETFLEISTLNKKTI
jgi:hypothetical protein